MAFSPKTAPRWPKMASKTAKMATKTAKIGLREPKMAARCFQDGSRCTQFGLRWLSDDRRRPRRLLRGLQDGPISLQEISREGPKRPKCLSFLRCSNDFGICCVSVFRLPKKALLLLFLLLISSSSYSSPTCSPKGSPKGFYNDWGNTLSDGFSISGHNDPGVLCPHMFPERFTKCFREHTVR